MRIDLVDFIEEIHVATRVVGADVLRITQNDDGLEVRAVDSDRTIVAVGRFGGRLEGGDGVWGIENVPAVHRFLTACRKDGGDVTAVLETDGETPVRLRIASADESVDASIVLVAEEALPALLRVPNVRWTKSVDVERSGWDRMRRIVAGGLVRDLVVAFERVDDSVVAVVGDPGYTYVRIRLASGDPGASVDGKWDARQLSGVLEASLRKDRTGCGLMFTRGALRVVAPAETVSWEYVLPALNL